MSLKFIWHFRCEKNMQRDVSYKKTRGATRGASGRRFEILLLMLVFLRCQRTKEQFFLGSSCSEAGMFDDIVVVWREQGEYYAVLVQAKYRKDKTGLRLRQLVATKKQYPTVGSYQDYFLGNFQESYNRVKERWKTFQDYRLSRVVFILLINGTLRKGDFTENINKRTNDLEEQITGIFGGILTKLSTEQTQGIVHKEFLDSFRLLSLEMTMKELLNSVKTEIRESVATDSEDCEEIYRLLRTKIKIWCEAVNPTYLGASSDMWLSVMRERFQAFNHVTPEMVSGIAELDEALKTNNRRIALVSLNPRQSAGKVVRSLRDSGLWHVVLPCAHVAARPAEVARMWATSGGVLVVLEGCEVPAEVLGEEGIIIHVTTQRPGSHWFVIVDVEDYPLVFQGRTTWLRIVAPVQELQLISGIIPEIGAPLSNIRCSSYAHRVLTRCQYLPSNFFESVKDNEICAILGISFTKFKTLFPDLQPIYKYKNAGKFPADGRVFCTMSSPKYFFSLCQKYRNQNIHLVKLLKNGKWKWKRSYGDVITIKKLLNGRKKRYSEEELLNSSDRVLVVEGIPGMGISTLLRRMASLWFSNNENDWVIIVDLARCVTSLSSLEIRDVDNVVTILEMAEGAGNLAVGGLGREVLKGRLQCSGGVALFFDGVADIGSRNYPKLIELLKFIVDFTRVSKLVVGVRLDSAEFIEDSVCSVAFTLEPMDVRKSISHIKFLVQQHGAEDHYDNLRLNHFETPLLMLAGVKAAVTCGWHILRWYEEFIYQIVAIYIMRRLDMKSEHPLFEVMVGAWNRLSYGELLGIVYPNGNLFTDCKYSAKVGLVYSDRKQEELRFTHRGLTEYFNALHLSRDKVALETLLQGEPYCTILTKKFDLLNRILCQDFPLHEAIIAGNEDEVRKIMRNHPQRTLSVDVGGRTPLHLAALYRDISTARLLVRQAPTTVEAEDELLGWTPLMYAHQVSSDRSFLAILEARKRD